MIWPMRQPVPDGERLHVYYSGNESLHGDLFNTDRSGPRRLKARGERLSRQSSSLPNFGALCRASWRSGRLWALAPAIGGPYVGTATSVARELADRQLLVNVVTRKSGMLRAELLDGRGRVIEGFAAADCEPVRGDHQRMALRWRGGRRAPKSASRIRFLLQRCFLYGFGVE
ncbi:MAG: hypothetical protein VB859_14345 [Planctomycetaceae bacterium]